MILDKRITERSGNAGLGIETLSDGSKAYFVRIYGDDGDTIDIDVCGEDNAFDLFRTLTDSAIFHIG